MGLRERVIELLSGLEGKYIPQSYIHRALGASKSRVSEILRELELEGLIERHSLGRVNIVHVKPGAFKRVIKATKSRTLRLGLVYSSEYTFLGFLVKSLERKGVAVDVVVFRDGFYASRQLAEGIIDLVFSPLVSQVYLYPAYRTYKVIGSGVKGGFRVLYKPGSSVVYSSVISTMDYVRYQLLRKGLIDTSRTHYYRSPSELISVSRRGGYVITWHPVYLRLQEHGYTAVAVHEELDVDFCCTLAALSSLGDTLLDLVQNALESALEKYKKKPDAVLDYYSSVTGIDTSTLRSALSEYTVAESLDKKHVDHVLETLVPALPDKSAYDGILYSGY